MLRAHIEKLVELSDEEYSFVRSHFTIRNFQKGSFMIEKGNPVRNAYLIISGLTKLVYHNADLREHIISFAMEDWWETDYPAWFMGGTATLNLQCMEDTQAYSLSLEDFRIICAKVQKMEHFFLEKANRGHVASMERILSFLAATPRERYELLLKKQPALMQRVPKAMLAAYLGVSRETLSRLWRSPRQR